jgi:translation initiation factor IF-2
MFDERGNKVEEAGPADPVRVIGFDGLPQAGDILTVVQNEVEARIIATQRAQRKREQEFRMVRHVTLDDISKQIRVGSVKELYLIIKGDVSGSVEALSDSLQKLSTDEVRVVILHKGVGSINESDVMLAAASGAVVIGFQVSPTTKARKVGETEAVDIRLYNIIYDCINEVRLALEGLLTPDTKEDVTATVEIRAVFRISKTGSIAGCHVTDGKITRNDRVRILRDGLPIYNGTIQSLKRNKDDVREVDSGYECGIFFDGFSDFEAGDIVESYKLVEVKRTIS